MAHDHSTPVTPIWNNRLRVYPGPNYRSERAWDDGDGGWFMRRSTIVIAVILAIATVVSAGEAGGADLD